MSSLVVSSLTISFLLFFISQTGAKPVIKTIKTEHGDIFDCIDIYKQPSLDHPLLQNHTLQMKPSFAPEALAPNSSTNEAQYANVELEEVGCPDGSVPVRRVRKDVLRRASTYLKEHPLDANSFDKPGWHFANVITHKLGAQIKAARGLLNVYNPRITNDQHSDSLIYVKIGKFESHNVIHAGWTVFPAIYGDHQTRLHTLWTADNYFKTGCVDMRCKGFVQISKAYTLGSVIKPTSQYGDAQYHIPIAISQDQFSGNWWLTAGPSVMVGYWPKELFTDLGSHAESAGWGGRVYSPPGSPTPSPPMGSGHRVGEGSKKSCYVKEMQFMRPGRGTYEDLNADLVINHMDSPGCYDLRFFMDYNDKANIFFGGPGGQCGDF